jgi:hypothetical protein
MSCTTRTRYGPLPLCCCPPLAADCVPSGSCARVPVPHGTVCHLWQGRAHAACARSMCPRRPCVCSTLGYCLLPEAGSHGAADGGGEARARHRVVRCRPAQAGGPDRGAGQGAGPGLGLSSSPGRPGQACLAQHCRLFHPCVLRTKGQAGGWRLLLRPASCQTCRSPCGRLKQHATWATAARAGGT